MDIFCGVSIISLATTYLVSVPQLIFGEVCTQILRDRKKDEFIALA